MKIKIAKINVEGSTEYNKNSYPHEGLFLLPSNELFCVCPHNAVYNLGSIDDFPSIIIDGDTGSTPPMPQCKPAKKEAASESKITELTLLKAIAVALNPSMVKDL